MSEENLRVPSMSMRAGITREKIVKMADAHLGELEAHLLQWRARLDDLVAGIEAAGSTVKIDYHKCIDDVKSKYQTAQVKFAEFKSAGSAQWGAFKAGIEHAWNDVERAFAKLGPIT